MAQPLAQDQTYHLPSPRRRRSYVKSKDTANSKVNRVAAVTKASRIQLEADERELFYSAIAFLMKIGLLSLGIASVLKLGVASHQILKRHMELSSVLQVEEAKLERLTLRFDSLFTLGGESRLMQEQVQWITPNSKRVIWR